MNPSPNYAVSTPEATAAQAQSREGLSPVSVSTPDHPLLADQAFYCLADSITRADRVVPYERKPSDPVYRPLKIFTLDPATSLLVGSVAVINLPYEPVALGPEGALFKVEPEGKFLDLEHPSVLIRSGVDPSMSDPLFRNQMTYAVCSSVYASFRAALGRYIAWGFNADAGFAGPLKLTIRPVGFEGQNAYYEKRDGSLQFGWYRGDKTKTTGSNLPGGSFYTCLSHDIVAHEVTHALLDGLRANFTFPAGPDVLAFHEAFADLVAIFQRFSYDGVVHAAIWRAGPDLKKSDLLTDIAKQFGQTTSGQTALRSAIDVREPAQLPKQYGQNTEPHALGSILVSAVFDAFSTIFARKVQPYIRLATDGSGVLRAGELPSDLVDVLAKNASRLASQFLSIIIRAVDYCPPVDLRFGDFLRAMITADHDLVPDDPYRYREAIIDAFRSRAIFPVHVDNLSEDTLIWKGPRKTIDPIPGLDFASLRFRGDPQNAASGRELVRQARCLGDIVCQPALMNEFGLLSKAEGAQRGWEVEHPSIHSIRSTRRVGPDGQVVFDLVAEITQMRTLVQDGRKLTFLGGATVILGPHGEIRYVISKSIASSSRLNDQLKFLESESGRTFWEETRLGLTPRPELFRLLHSESDHLKQPFEPT